jgi:hypothetical protein
LSAKSDILAPKIGELSAVISQQASPPQAKQSLVWQVLVERRMKYDLSAGTALHLDKKYREPGAKRPGREPEKDLTESPGEPESPDPADPRARRARERPDREPGRAREPGRIFLYILKIVYISKTK